MSSDHPLLEPYTPTDSDPFDAVKAAHLLNRAGFGGTPDEVEHIRSLGPQAAVDEMLDFPDVPAEEQSQFDVPDLSAIDGIPTSFRELKRQLDGATEQEKRTIRMKFNMANAQVLVTMGHWWMKRMATGPHPFQEKLTLFWHGHFTTSAKDEHMSSLMWKQNELLRRCAAGNFGTLTHEISHDPAMLDYLNNTQNRKEHPNENYARELMELFTLGIGNYTETDVKQGARAFTGWTHDGEEFVFHKQEHDFGIKTYLGRTGNLNGDDVVDIILQQRACAPFVAGELYRFFVADEVPAGLAEALGESFYDDNYDLRPLLRTMLTSQAFYSPKVIGAQIKSPVQLMAGSIHLLGVQVPPEQRVMGMLTQMGQVPFLPPNVRGWIGGRTWINTSTLFVRYNLGVWLTGGDGREHPDSVDFDPAIVTDQNPVDYWVNRLIQRPISPDQRKVLIAALGNFDGPADVRKVVQLIVSMPEYQLC
jgi:uncharacterized protein (DUF1800 family)